MKILPKEILNEGDITRLFKIYPSEEKLYPEIYTDTVKYTKTSLGSHTSGYTHILCEDQLCWYTHSRGYPHSTTVISFLVIGFIAIIFLVNITIWYSIHII